MRGGGHAPGPARGPRRSPLWRAATDGERALPRAASSRSPPPPRPPRAARHGWRPARASAAAAAQPPPPPVGPAVTPPAACVAGARPAGGGVFRFPIFSRRGPPSCRTTHDARAPAPASSPPRCKPYARRAAGMALPWWLVAPSTALGFAAASITAAASVAGGALTGGGGSGCGGGGGGGDASTSASCAAVAAARRRGPPPPGRLRPPPWPPRPPPPALRPPRSAGCGLGQRGRGAGGSRCARPSSCRRQPAAAAAAAAAREAVAVTTAAACPSPFPTAPSRQRRPQEGRPAAAGARTAAGTQPGHETPQAAVSRVCARALNGRAGSSQAAAPVFETVTRARLASAPRPPAHQRRSETPPVAPWPPPPPHGARHQCRRVHAAPPSAVVHRTGGGGRGGRRCGRPPPPRKRLGATDAAVGATRPPPRRQRRRCRRRPSRGGRRSGRARPPRRRPAGGRPHRRPRWGTVGPRTAAAALPSPAPPTAWGPAGVWGRPTLPPAAGGPRSRQRVPPIDAARVRAWGRPVAAAPMVASAAPSAPPRQRVRGGRPASRWGRGPRSHPEPPPASRCRECARGRRGSGAPPPPLTRGRAIDGGPVWARRRGGRRRRVWD